MEVSTQPRNQQLKAIEPSETADYFLFFPFVQILLNKVHYVSIFLSLSGGTSVSSALECPPEETRSIVSLDTSQMVGTIIQSDHLHTHNANLNLNVN